MILITGHKGFVGSRLYNKLISLYGKDKVIGIDLKDGNDIIHNIPKNEYDVIFHMAAMPKVEFSVENPSYTLYHNVYGTSKILEFAVKNNVKKVIFSSSSAIYGNNGVVTSPYGLHKLQSELECKLYSNLYNLDVVCLRYFNIYSEDQEYGGSYSTVISSWMHLLKNNKPLRIDGDGSQTRDYIHVEDIVNANIFCYQSQIKFNADCYDVGSGTVVSLNDIKNFIDNKYHNVEWLNAPERIGDVKHTKANIKPFLELGWKPTIDINDGLERCFK
jgi:UDP-glucose 4-epimerase